MSAQTEILTERINTINSLLVDATHPQYEELIQEKEKLLKQLQQSNFALQEGKQLLKG